jgi:hypothetical protein
MVSESGHSVDESQSLVVSVTWPVTIGWLASTQREFRFSLSLFPGAGLAFLTASRRRRQRVDRMEPPATGASSAFEPSPEMEQFLCERLLDVKQPIAERFRALFSLRNLRGDAPRRALLQGPASPHRSYSPLVLCYFFKA